MDILEFKDLEDWRLKNECYPFEDSLGNLCITIESEYESFGGEKDARLKEAKEYGIDRLIRFYGKTYVSTPVTQLDSDTDITQITISQTNASVTPITPTNLYDAASTPDYFISQRVCARMKVLVKIPKDTFDAYTVNNAFCDIYKPAEGYLSAFISVENYERDIDYITTSMEDFLPKMAKADKYMTNINIVKEIKRLKQVKNVIRRYFNLNSVTATAIKEEECEPDKQSQMEIGFSYDYNPAFALIDGNKHTIGYDCFLEASLLSHPTTANYLIQLGSMSSALTKQLSLDFDIFQFLTQHTYPTPVIEIKKNSLDGIEKYDSNGNLFSFANLAKLITLELDKKSCKTDEDKQREDDVVFSDATKNNIANTVRQSKDFVGNMSLKSEGAEDLGKTFDSMDYYADNPDLIWNKVYNDVLDKIDFNCVLEESLKCALEAAITRLGEAAFNDPDLSDFFSADGAVKWLGLCGTDDDNCEKEWQLKVELPAFQGIKIPDNFPTTDYVAKAIDAALKQLYSALINAIVSFIEKIFELMCKMISELPDTAAIKSMFGDGFKSWLSDTIGVDVSKLSDGKAWADAALSAGGTGFMGAVGNLTSKAVGSWDALISETGISLNLPNPNTGLVEQVLVSPELIYQTMSGVQKATEDLEVVLTSGELKSLYKGTAPDDVMELAFGCLNRGNPDLFQSREDVSDLFSQLGEMVNTNFLEESATTPITVTNACGLGDGTNQDILAKNYLTSKDPLLSDSEIEELLSQEKNRLIEKIKQIYKLLKSFQDGTLFPSFPSLFGSDDSLIPEPPPVIDDAMKTAASGMYASAINNLNSIIVQYPDIWDTVFINEINGESVNLNRLYVDASTADGLDITLSSPFSVSNEGDTIVMGYVLPAEVTTIESEEYIEVLEGSTMTDGWWYYGTGVDLGSYTSEATNSKTDSDHYPLFRDMLNVLGLKEYEASDRKDIIKEIQDTTELLRDFLHSRFYEFWADIFTSFNFLDRLNWDDLNRYRKDVKGTLQKEMDNVFSQLGVTIEDWMTYDAECRELVYNNARPIVALDGKNTINDSDDPEDFHKIVEVSSQVNDLYYKAKAALVVMDIADYLEDWDDGTAGDNGSFASMDENINWDSGKRKKMVDPLPEYIDGSYEEPNGQVTLVYNITDVITDDKKLEFATEYGDGDPDNITAMAHITFRTDFTRKDEHYVKASFVITKAGEDVEIDAVRDGADWTETLTTLERKGARLIAATDTSSEEIIDNLAEASTHSGGSLANIHNAITSGGNSEYDVVAANKIITNIGNYKIANDLMISLGRKEAKSNLLEERYSFTNEEVNFTLSDWWSSDGPMNTSATSATAGRFEEIVIAAGGTQYFDGTAKDYMEYINNLINDMRYKVMTSQYGDTDAIREMMDSYVKSDAIKYKDLTKWAEGHVSEVMKIQQLDEMCDALTPNRRTAASMGVRMLTREFILESALISLQVFDTFNTGFMESAAFRQTVFDNMKTEMKKKYSNSFEDTIENNIFSDIKDAAVKYYEYKKLLGEEIEIESAPNTLLSVIGEEIDEIRESIASSLQLSETGTWNDFVLDELLPSAGFTVEQDYNESGEYYFIDVKYATYQDSTLNPSLITLFSSQCGGTADEGSKEGGGEDICGDVENIIVSGKYLTIRQQLFEDDDYKEFVNNIFPFRELVTQLSVYQASALSDVAVFSGTYEGRNLFDIFAETKLSTLQVLLASLHGAGETTYIDPFLEKLKT
jgi:hypothetical protein